MKINEEYDRLVNRLAQFKAAQAKYETVLAWHPSYINDVRERKCEQALGRINSEICKVMNELDNCINSDDVDSFIPHFE